MCDASFGGGPWLDGAGILREMYARGKAGGWLGARVPVGMRPKYETRGEARGL